MKIKKILLVIFTILLFIFISENVYSACEGSEDYCAKISGTTQCNATDKCYWNETAHEPGSDTDSVSLKNPITGTPDTIDQKTISNLIGKIIKGVLGIVGSLALVMFIYGGFVWMTAAGNNEKVSKGKDILIWAALGLVVIFTSYALVKFVLVDVLGGTAKEPATAAGTTL